jgi:hypothetical protein
MARTRDEHLFGPGPKRILALDGGGIRGALTLEYLARIEDLLRARAGGRASFRLSDYFDLIGGTSTGSIIAAGLALGFEVAKLQKLYRDLAAAVFQRPFWRFGAIVSKFPRQPLVDALIEHFGDATVGSDALRTGLMIMTKRLDTGSPWPIHNNPRGRYFEARPGGGLANRDLRLRDVVRASTAAPHYFEPERISVAAAAAGAVDGAFIDGGVSPSNNPALQLLLFASLKGYGLGWPLAPDRLLIASVGTGFDEIALSTDEVMSMPAALLAVRSLAALMDDCTWLGQTILQWLGESPTAWEIDREIGDLRGDSLDGRKLFTYLRYNARLERDWLRDRLGLDLAPREVEGLRTMDDPGNVDALARVGAAAARVQVRPEHFPAAFDVAGPAPAGTAAP